MDDPMLAVVVRAVRATAEGDLSTIPIEPHHSFVEDLGFDSMAVVMLGIALEDELNRSVMLDGWIARHTDPRMLTVGSLADYLRETVRESAASSV